MHLVYNQQDSVPISIYYDIEQHMADCRRIGIQMVHKNGENQTPKRDQSSILDSVEASDSSATASSRRRLRFKLRLNLASVGMGERK